MHEWPHPTRLAYSLRGVLRVMEEQIRAFGELGAGVGNEPQLVVGDVGERASCFFDPVAERRSRMGHARRGDRQPVELPGLVAELDELDVDGRSANGRGKNGGDR